MNIKKILQAVDHTELRVDANWQDIKQICDDALKYNVASICIPPYYVKRAADYLKGKIKIDTVIGFPNGYSTLPAKQAETAQALSDGASEIDMVINIAALKNKEYAYIENEIKTLKAICHDCILKVIIETALLDESEKIKMCEIVTSAKADFIKTSTGFSISGATFEDIQLMAKHIGPNVKIKAAGGISSLEDAQKFLDLGASRLGTSRIIKILKTNPELIH
ncbi:MAG: deoxyribose-phosphate aldolase [Clostridiaceae bacterium]|nr:deoxyribose-phosphate aldolase [Clostridiaceae bacterium]